MKIRTSVIALLGALTVLAGCAVTPDSAGKRSLMITGNDEKVTWNDVGLVLKQGEKHSMSIVDIGTNPLAPKIIADLPLDNSIMGPPTNLAISPDETLAVMANSVNVIMKDGKPTLQPDDRLFVIDLTSNPPKLIDTVIVGKQPSGLSFNRAGNLILIANRNSNDISVLRVAGKKVTLIDTVAIGEQVAHVRFTPDGKRALAAKFPGHKVAFLDVNGEKVTYNKLDVLVGFWPYNLDVTPDGKIALTADNGFSGAADGNTDTVSVIDIEANPPRVIDKVVVGDAPEGIAISPTGKLAVVALIAGSNSPHNAFFYNRDAYVVALKIDGKKVTRTNEVKVRGLPEGIVFSDDGRYVYVGNYLDRDVSILRVDGDQLVDTGKSLKLPGQPGSMRGKTLF